MADQKTVSIVCGDARVEARLPERTTVLQAPAPLPPLPDPAGAIRAALAGVEDTEAARLVGFDPFATVEEAMAEAEASLGKDCAIAHPSMPAVFLTSVGG